jgi:dihydroxyacetone kinase-like protein
MIINKHIHKAFEEKNIKIYDSDVNSYCTTQEMAGASISVLKLDDELKDLYNQRASSPYYYKKGRS